MIISSFENNLTFSDDRVNTSLILETVFSKDIRIVFKKGQKMKEHKTPYPIIVHVLSGEIDFGCAGKSTILPTGSVLSLEGNVPHDLTAIVDSVVRLTLSKLDQVARVQNVAATSN